MKEKILKEATQQWEFKTPLVSICCISFNQANYISETIGGFLCQKTNFPFEIIIGDDASTDGTQKILEEYAIKYNPLIRLIFNKKNKGAISNLTNVASQAKGKYIAFCEGDDYWHEPNKLQLQIDFLETNPDYSICCHDYNINIDGNIFETDQKIKFDCLNIEEYSKTLPNIQTLTVVFRNSLNPLIPENLLDKVTGTVFIYLRLADIGKIKFFDHQMATYRIHSSGIWSGKTERQRTEMALQNIEAMHDFFSARPDIARDLANRHAFQSITFANRSLVKRSLVDFIYFSKKSCLYGVSLVHLKATLFFYWNSAIAILKKITK